jgi:hypothetical protein
MSRNPTRLVIAAVCCVTAFNVTASPRSAPTGDPFGQLTLELVEPGACQSSVMVCVELWMRDIVNTNVTGFNAFVTYDETVLSFNCDESSYTDLPFPLHIPGDICDAIGDPPHPGRLDLSSSDVLGGEGTNEDSLLATLCFDVLFECGNSSIGFTHFPPFYTELSFEGLPVATGLGQTPLFTNDETPPEITCPANLTIGCNESSHPDNTGYPSATDNCDDIGDIEITWVDNFPLNSPPEGVCEVIINRTFSVKDSCGNTSTCDQVITQVDTEPPMLDFIEPVIKLQHPKAGFCCRPLPPQDVTASDDCTEFPVITCTRDDGADCTVQLFYCGDPADYPGDTVHFNTWKATDLCGNEDVFVQEVRIPSYNVLNVDLQLEGVGDPFPPPGGECERCIHFETEDCVGFDGALTFTDPGGISFYSFAGEITMPCGDWEVLCIKDPQHSLWETRSLTIAQQEYHLAAALLPQGDTDNDGDVDIHDVTWWVFQGQSQIIPPFTCPWESVNRDADFNCDGVITFLPDYTIMTSHWMYATTCTGCPVPNPVDQAGSFPGATFDFAIPADAVPPEVAETVDANRDGRIDYRDVRIFEAEMALPHYLSDLIEITQFVFDPPADAP